MTIEDLEQLDSCAHPRNLLRKLAEHAGEWAGIPMPLPGERLVIEPTYPFAETIKKIDDEHDEEIEDTQPGWTHRNSFWSHRHRRDVHVWQEADGRITHSFSAGIGHLDMQIRTAACSCAWGVEQEAKAIRVLCGLVRHHTFKSYMLTGSFIETSKRSGLTYMFRRLRPTIVLTTGHKSGYVRGLCALCQHPIGYYDQTWAGAMCPTDEVIAHLMLMRADEHMLWKRSNQHPLNRPEAGV